MVGAGGILTGRSRQDLEDEAAAKSKAEQEGKLHQYMVNAGTAQSQSLLSQGDREEHQRHPQGFCLRRNHARRQRPLQPRQYRDAEPPAQPGQRAGPRAAVCGRSPVPLLAAQQAERDRDIVGGKTAGHYYGSDRQAAQARINVDTTARPSAASVPIAKTSSPPANSAWPTG